MVLVVICVYKDNYNNVLNFCKTHNLPLVVYNKNDNLKGFGNVNYHTINILSIYDNYNFIINYK